MVRLHKLTGTFRLIVPIFAHWWRQSAAVEITERHSAIINAAERRACPLQVLQTEVLQLFWLSRPVAALLVFLIISVLIWLSVSTIPCSSILTPIFQSGRTRRLRALLIHFHVPRSLLMKELFTFLTPNWTFVSLTRLVCRCIPAGFACAGFCLMGPLLNSFSIMRHGCIIWWYKSSWCPYSSCHRVQMCRLGSLGLFFSFRGLHDDKWNAAKAQRCGLDKAERFWADVRWFVNETPSIFISFTPRTVCLSTCYCESFDGWNQHCISGAQPSSLFWGEYCPFQHNYSIDVMQPIIKKNMIVHLQYSCSTLWSRQTVHAAVIIRPSRIIIIGEAAVTVLPQQHRFSPRGSKSLVFCMVQIYVSVHCE